MWAKHYLSTYINKQVKKSTLQRFVYICVCLCVCVLTGVCVTEVCTQSTKDRRMNRRKTFDQPFPYCDIQKSLVIMHLRTHFLLDVSFLVSPALDLLPVGIGSLKQNLTLNEL